MKKSLILPLLVILCSCNGNTSSSEFVSSIETSSSSSTSTIPYASTSTSSNTQISSTNTVYDVKTTEMQLIETEDKTGYLVEKYSGTKNSKIRLPESYNNKPIVGIVELAFYSASFEDVYIPNSYVEINALSFFGCTVIKNFFFEESNTLFKSVDGVAYSKNGEKLCVYPSGRRDTYNVVDGTKVIANSAFMYSNVKNVVLPESITTIEDNAFNSAKRLRTINIPSKVKVINESTFDTCSELKTITFSEGLEKIGYKAFWQCTNLSNLQFPTSLREIGESGFEGLSGETNLVLNEGLVKIGDFAFAYNEDIETIQFPSTLKEIGQYAFMQNYKITELHLNEGLEILKEGAFFYNTNLRRVYIPSTLEEIGFDCFSSSDSKFETLVVSEDSPTYKLQDGILYSKDGKEIVYCPSQNKFTEGTYTIPEGVEVIRDHAFYNCSNLNKVVLPSTLKEIGKAPFYTSAVRIIEYSSTIEDFEKIETTLWQYNTGMYDENNNLVLIDIFWYMINYENGIAITTVKCSDGDLSLVSTDE